tara:strand:+ start:823 stop:939 length:117 start_codon:yes stop_codon:yes gene_type:complete
MTIAQMIVFPMLGLVLSFSVWVLIMIIMDNLNRNKEDK